MENQSEINLTDTEKTVFQQLVEMAVYSKVVYTHELQGHCNEFHQISESEFNAAFKNLIQLELIETGESEVEEGQAEEWVQIKL